MKKLFIYNSINIKHVSLRITASKAAIMKWLIWLKDAIQAFIQSEEMKRSILLRPKPEFNLPPGTLLKLLKYLYMDLENPAMTGIAK